MAAMMVDLSVQLLAVSWVAHLVALTALTSAARTAARTAAKLAFLLAYSMAAGSDLVMVVTRAELSAYLKVVRLGLMKVGRRVDLKVVTMAEEMVDLKALRLAEKMDVSSVATRV